MRKRDIERLRTEGVPASAEVVEASKKFWADSRNTLNYDVTARFDTADGRRVQSKQVVPFLAWEKPKIGSHLPIRYDPHDPERWCWDDDSSATAPSISVEGTGQVRTGPDGQIVITRENGSSASDIASELERLATLHSQGALSDEEFAAAKAHLLGGP